MMLFDECQFFDVILFVLDTLRHERQGLAWGSIAVPDPWRQVHSHGATVGGRSLREIVKAQVHARGQLVVQIVCSREGAVAVAIGTFVFRRGKRNPNCCT